MGNLCFTGERSLSVSSCGDGGSGSAVERAWHAARRERARLRGVRFEDKYKMTRLLGKGGFARVVACAHKESGAVFAAKLIEKDSMDLEGLDKEVAIAKLLSTHPATLQVYEVYEEPDRYVLIMELCRGGELFDRIVKKGHFSEREAARFIRGMLGFLAHAHSHNVVHCDLKPENMMLLNDSSHDEKLILKVADYGCCNICPPGQKLKKAQGTPAYAAPEMLRNEYDCAADIWSIGVIAYVLFVGYPPFHGKNNSELTRKVQEGKYSLESQGWDEVSAAAKAFVAAMLQHNPAHRPSAEELLKHPWFDYAESCECSSPAPAPTLGQERASGMVSRLRDYLRATRFQRLAHVVLARRHEGDDDEEARRLRALFSEVDTDGSCTIDREEFRNAVHRLGTAGAAVDEAEVDLLFDAADFDGTGRLEYGEFLAAVGLGKRRIEQHPSGAAAELLSVLDADGNGYVTADELVQALPPGATLREAESLLRGVDLNGDGRLDVDEIRAILARKL